MSLQSCTICHKEVWSGADQCPHCGARIKKTSITTKAIIILFLGGAFLGFITDKPDKPTTPPPPKTASEIRTEKIAAGFSPWDGSHRGLERVIKASMNDPDSFVHDETRYWDKGDSLIVNTSFRGKNAFGGVVRNSVTAKVDLEGNVLEIISQNP